MLNSKLWHELGMAGLTDDVVSTMTEVMHEELFCGLQRI